jgi:hypothetical protein
VFPPSTARALTLSSHLDFFPSFYLFPFFHSMDWMHSFMGGAVAGAAACGLLLEE